MTDVIDRLARLDGSPAATGDGTVTADLDRAHRALGRRRRTRAAFAGAGLTLAMGGGLGAVVAADRPDESAGVDLVRYDGQQPEGFEIAQIPEGFFAQGSNPYSFTVAREGDTSHPDGFEDKLVVMLETGLAPAGRLKGDPVSVDGHPGAVRDSGEALSLEFHDGRHEVVVQMWDSVGLDVDQLVEFAEGIAVTADARREEPTNQEGTTIEKDGGIWRIVPKPE